MHKSNPEPEYLLEELRSIGLPAESRARMRASLSAYADFHAAEHRPAHSMTGAFAWLSAHRFAPVAAALVLALFGGSAYAAEGTLPGDALYTIKVHVNEPLGLAFAVTDEQEAEAHAAIAERRLEEAARLAVRLDLTEDTKAQIEASFSTHVDESLEAMQKLEDEGETTAALEARSALEARLVAHADILDLVEDRLEEAGEPASIAHFATQDFLKAVRLRQSVVSETRIALERDYEDKVSETETLAVVSHASASVPDHARAAHLPSVAEHVHEAEDALDEARASLAEDPDDQRAFRKAWEARRESEIISILFKNQDILSTIGPATTTSATTTPNASATTTATTTSPLPLR